MKELSLDMAELAFAFEDPSSDTNYYLDLDTGSVIMVRPELDDLSDLRGEIEMESERYLYVPKPKENQLELDLADFAFTCADPKLKTMIELAMESPNRYASLRSILQKVEGEWQRWEDWKKQSSRQRALRWLEAQQIKVSPL
ncbi:MAG: UPF0158 family protein [Candidatus Obscuribacterales bacterium]|nr:UPF0158 family protein [Candidatus Obscuribacterales bacterium]